jgi:hypothetical protein
LPDIGRVDAIKWLDGKGGSDGKIQAIEKSASAIASAKRSGHSVNVGGFSPTINVHGGGSDVGSQVQDALEEQLPDLIDAIQDLLSVESQRSASPQPPKVFHILPYQVMTAQKKAGKNNDALASTKLLSAWILVPSTKPALTHCATTRLKSATKTSWPQRLRALIKTL